MLKQKRLNRLTVFDRINVLVLLLLCFVMLYPLWWVLLTSLADPVWLSSNTVRLLPAAFSLNAYRYILSNNQIWLSYGNSIFYAAVRSIIADFESKLEEASSGMRDLAQAHISEALMFDPENLGLDNLSETMSAIINSITSQLDYDFFRQFDGDVEAMYSPSLKPSSRTLHLISLISSSACSTSAYAD